MARLNRVSPAGIPQHIIQRGTNRQAIFAGEADMKAYLSCLKVYSESSERVLGKEFWGHEFWGHEFWGHEFCWGHNT